MDIYQYIYRYILQNVVENLYSPIPKHFDYDKEKSESKAGKVY